MRSFASCVRCGRPASRWWTLTSPFPEDRGDDLFGYCPSHSPSDPGGPGKSRVSLGPMSRDEAVACEVLKS